MTEKVHDGFSSYSLADRLAIAAFLKSLPPDDFDPEQWRLVRKARKRLDRETDD